jgi:hypothetical protein
MHAQNWFNNPATTSSTPTCQHLPYNALKSIVKDGSSVLGNSIITYVIQNRNRFCQMFINEGVFNDFIKLLEKNADYDQSLQILKSKFAEKSPTKTM